MSTSAPRRERVERGIYRRPSGVLEVGYKDETGRLRWRTINGGVLAARKVRDDLNARRARGESIVPKAKLRFGEASQAWLVGPVLDLRDTTQAKYRCMIRERLDPRFALTTLDTISADDMASLVRELRSEGKSEATIVVILSVVAHVYKYALRRLGWSGMIPTTLMLRSERPKVSRTKRRPIFTGVQLEQTIAAATEPFRTLFVVAALTGARVSELCGLTWADIHIEDPEDAEIEFGFQVDRHGIRRPTKTDGSARTVPIAHEPALVLNRHHDQARYPDQGALCSRPALVVLCGSATLRVPYGRRNAGPSAPTDCQRFRSCISSTPAACPWQSHPPRCRRCTPSDIRSRHGRSLPARASMRWRSCSDTAMGLSPVRSTYVKLPMHAAGQCVDPG